MYLKVRGNSWCLTEVAFGQTVPFTLLQVTVKTEYAPAYLVLDEGKVCIQHLHSALFSRDFLCVPALGGLTSNWLCKNIPNLACV